MDSQLCKSAPLESGLKNKDLKIGINVIVLERFILNTVFLFMERHFWQQTVICGVCVKCFRNHFVIEVAHTGFKHLGFILCLPKSLFTS